MYGYIIKQEILVKKFNKIHNIENKDEINKYYSRINATITGRIEQSGVYAGSS
jgi:hypothetical protein